MRFLKCGVVCCSVILLALGSVTWALGQEGPVKTVQAEVVSASADSLTVKPDGAGDGAASLVLKIDEQTKIIKNGRPIDSAELSSGDRVSVNYRKNDDDSLVALAISVIS